MCSEPHAHESTRTPASRAATRARRVAGVRGVTAMACGAALACGAAVAAPAAEGLTVTGRVTAVADGDTLTVAAGERRVRVRLVGVDAPEIYGDVPQCGGWEATDRARRLVPRGATVRVVTDPTQRRFDRWGRLLGYVFVPGARGARGSVNYRLIREGLARVDTKGWTPFAYRRIYVAGQQAAVAEGRGLWGPPCRERPAAAQASRAATPSSATMRSISSGGWGRRMW